MLINHKFGDPGAIGNKSCVSWNVGEPYGLGVEFGNPFGSFGTLDFPGHNGATYGFFSQSRFDKTRGAAYVAGAATDMGWPSALWEDLHSNIPTHVSPAHIPTSKPISYDSLMIMMI